MGHSAKRHRMQSGADVSERAEAGVSGEGDGGGLLRQVVLRRLHSSDQIGVGEAKLRQC